MGFLKQGSKIMVNESVFFTTIQILKTLLLMNQFEVWNDAEEWNYLYTIWSTHQDRQGKIACKNCKQSMVDLTRDCLLNYNGHKSKYKCNK